MTPFVQQKQLDSPLFQSLPLDAQMIAPHLDWKIVDLNVDRLRSELSTNT